MSDPEPAVHIGLSAIYQEVLAIKARLGPIAQDLKALRRSTHDSFEDHETRIRASEGGRMPWGVISGLVGLGALGVATVALFVK